MLHITGTYIYAHRHVSGEVDALVSSFDRGESTYTTSSGMEHFIEDQ